MKIYFVTHATSEDNEKGIASGWKDTGLSNLGKQQAKEREETFKDIKIDLVCCSDLKRAVNTVQIAFGQKYPIIVDKRLRELNYGGLNGKPVEIVEQMKSKRIKESFPDGESYEQAMARIHDFLREMKSNYPEKVILVVGHSATQFGLETFVSNRTINDCLSTPFKWQRYWEYDL